MTSLAVQTDFAEDMEMSQKIRVEPHHIFGLRREARNNLLFSGEQTVIFPSGNYCVQYDICQRSTKFIPGAVGLEGIQALAISPNKHYLAVSQEGIITVYDLQSKQCSKRQVLTGGNIDVREFVCMAFSADSKYLLGQSRGPEWTLFYWEWKKNEVIATVKTTNLGFVSQVSFNPMDNTQICVSGNYVIKIFKLENNTLNQVHLSDMDLENVMSHAWMSEDCIVLGTETGKLLMLKAKHWHKLERPTKSEVKMDPNATVSPADTLPNISAITQYSNGFACAVEPGIVCLYKKKGEYGYEETTEIRIPQDPCSIYSGLQEITAICMSPSEKTLAISTRQGQIYTINLTSVKMSKSKQASFKFLFHSSHQRSITSLSACASRPLFATCSKDNSVRIWNYKTNSLDLYKEFPEEPKCISLHPNGFSILVGFSDKVCLMYLLVDGFCTVKEFDIRNSNECVFNHDGNLFAAVSDSLISICNVRTGEKVELNSHTDKVLQVKWSEDDRRLVSCGMDGTLYEWNALTGAQEKLHNLCTCVHAMLLTNTGSILTVGNDFTLNELRNGEIVWETASDGVAYTALSMTHSGQAVFVGTAAGTVRVMQYPFDEKNSWTDHQAHSGPITQMAVTPDDQYLLTASEDSSLLIWTITDQKGCKLCTVNKIDDTEEFLLQKKVLNFEKEEQRIITEKLKASQENTLNEMMRKHAEELQNQLESLEHKNKMSKMSEKHEWEQKLQALRQSYEEKLREHEDNHLRTTMDMRQAYEHRLHCQEEKLQQSEEKLKELQEKVDSEFKDVFHQYDQKLQAEKENNMKLENEVKVIEKQMIHLWKIKKEIQNQYLEISQLEAKIKEMNSRHEEAIEELNQKLHIQDQQLIVKNKKFRNMKVLVQRMKADIHNCSIFLHKPKMLMKNFLELHKTYIHESDVTLEAKDWKVQEHTKKAAHLQRTVVSQKQSQTMEATNQQTECSIIVKQKKEKEIKNLTEEKEQNQTILDKEVDFQDIVKMHVKSRKQNKEDLISINKQLDQLYRERKRPTRQTAETELEQLQNWTQEKKLILQKLDVEMEEIDMTRIETMYGLKEKLKLKEQELCTEKQRARNLGSLIKRMKTDIQNCSSFILQPRMLEENFMKLHNSYIQEPHEKVRVKTGDVQEQKKEQLQRTVVPQKKRQLTETKIQQADYATIQKQSTKPANELTQERATKTQKIVLNTPFSRGSQLKSRRELLTLPRLPDTRNQRPKMEHLVWDTQEHQAACCSSVRTVKFPHINSTKNTK